MHRWEQLVVKWVGGWVGGLFPGGLQGSQDLEYSSQCLWGGWESSWDCPAPSSARWRKGGGILAARQWRVGRQGRRAGTPELTVNPWGQRTSWETLWEGPHRGRRRTPKATARKRRRLAKYRVTSHQHMRVAWMGSQCSQLPIPASPTSKSSRLRWVLSGTPAWAQR